MLRLVIYGSGVVVGLVALKIWRDRQKAGSPMPVTQAANLLREAWADNHTQA